VNFSLSEMVLILVIALLVIKPDQLPDVAFTLGRFAQSFKRMFANIKDEMNSLVSTVEPPEKKRD
jgi:Sec-independent protein translocase protein TatA